MARAAEVAPEDRALLELATRAQLASLQNDAEGFCHFYRVIFGREIPPHARLWVEQIYEDYNNGKGTVIRAFRGSTKTTTITIGLAAFLIGHNPSGSGLLIQVGDDIATDNAAQVADIIENNPGWKLVFAHVVPDIDRGWGAGGYEVRLAEEHMDYSSWRAINAERKDPSFIGLGYKSRAIIGKHPTTFLFVDDIHDENNTSSDRELEKVKRIVTGTIFPTLMPDTLRVFVGTPWNEEDVLEYVMETGEYNEHNTPVYERGKNGKGRSVWPRVFTPQLILRKKRESGSVEFARMYRLDLKAAKVDGLRYFSYPNEAIVTSWPVVSGVDYASIEPERPGRDRDHFAMAYVMKVPTGGAVVFDGVVERVTQARAETLVEKAQSIFPGYIHAVVEGDGKGEEFIAVLMRKPHLIVVPMKTRGKGKPIRIGKEMAPWFENGLVRISDADTPFLNTLRKQMSDFPNGRHDDCLDAVYWALRGMPDVLTIEEPQERLPRARRRERQRNPFAALGRR